MTREEARKRAEIMLAYAEGKSIQFYNKNEDTWEDTDDPHFFAEGECRVKPEPKYRPYKNAKEFIEAQKEHGPYFTSGGCYGVPVFVADHGILIVRGNDTGLLELNFAIISSEPYKWQDGTPCGVFKE